MVKVAKLPRAWPFLTLRREELADLTGREMARLEKTLRSRLAEVREDRCGGIALIDERIRDSRECGAVYVVDFVTRAHSCVRMGADAATAVMLQQEG